MKADAEVYSPTTLYDVANRLWAIFLNCVNATVGAAGVKLGFSFSQLAHLDLRVGKKRFGVIRAGCLNLLPVLLAA